MSFFKGFVLLMAVAAVWCQECTDDSPDNELTCPELIGLGGGVCDQDFIKRDNRCARSCGRAPCPPVDLSSQGSVTLIGKATGEKTSAGPAPASVEISAPTPPAPAPTPPPPPPPPPPPAPAPAPTPPPPPPPAPTPPPPEVPEMAPEEPEQAPEEPEQAPEEPTPVEVVEEPTEPEVVEEVVEEVPETPTAADCKPLRDLIAGEGELSFLKSALESAGLVDTLNGFTGVVFAPTNVAFEALLSLLELSRDAFFSGNPQVIEQLLKIHVVPGAALTLDQLEGQTLTPLLGGSQKVSVSGGSITSPAGPTARVAKSLNEGCPAIIHIIDNVIIPRPGDGV
ncbi:hypothetical protein BSKO_10550 [Bryopsis sp. KO-2023]|nr:hypothetical protein BSKO_10550 [Bryopsis sp. KO-2023]